MLGGLYFRSDKSKATKVYNITEMKLVLGSDLCSQLLFIHAFTGCDTTSHIFSVGKQTAFQKLVNGESTIQSCVSTPTSSKECHRGPWDQGNDSVVWWKEY